MPTLTFKCPIHGYFTAWHKETVKEDRCPECIMKSPKVYRISGGLSVVERLDNGVMARAVERLHNIEEIVTEQADKSSREFKERAGETES